ncbi:hypothetical protein WMF27_41020 [Sorangium sp. So ce281]|uniref:hypothetical protein n=1 Tax=unclassified Sorangium TaxID=2621164 RepID=UPI003F616347
MKQLGSAPFENNRPMKLDKHGGDWKEWPDDLRVRQMPNVACPVLPADTPQAVSTRSTTRSSSAAR